MSNGDGSLRRDDAAPATAAQPASREPDHAPPRAGLRRRRRSSRIIDCPPPHEHAATANPLIHARRFTLALALIMVIGTLLLMTPLATRSGHGTGVYDAMFVAISAATVTGLTPVSTADHWSFFGQLVILILVQIGGLGFMVGASLVLALLRRSGSLRDAMLMHDGSPSLTLREALDFSGRIIRFTFITEGIGAVLLTLIFWLQVGQPLGTALWHGIFHSVAAFCNAGFDLSPGLDSLIPYRTNIGINVVIACLIQAGALSYFVFHDVWTRRKWHLLTLDTKLVISVNAVVLVGAAGLFLATEWSASLADTPVWARPMSAIFQSVSARTAGFGTVDFGHATNATLLSWIGVMGIGGAAGSTAGGVRLATFGVVVYAVLSALRGHTETQVFGRRLAPTLIFRAMAIITGYMAIYFVATIALAITQDDLINQRFSTASLMFETMSGLATVGLTTGITPEISNTGKVILALTMFLGRIGPLSFAYALQGRQRPPRYRYPEEAVRIG